MFELYLLDGKVKKQGPFIFYTSFNISAVYVRMGKRVKGRLYRTKLWTEAATRLR